jgi:hypothetical protein
MATGVFGLRKVYIKQNENIDNRNFASWPESATYGYFGGGFTPPQINTITRLDFSNETVSVPGKNLPSSRLRLSAVSSSYYGYYGGGFIPVSTNFNIISRLDFSNETVSDPGKNLPASISDLAATSSSSYGYFGGGFPGPVINTISRIDFSSETVSLPGNNLPTSRRALATVSSSFYGYFGGALAFPSTTYLCTISRIDFSNETVSDPGKNLPTARGNLAATSSSYYGYFGGGYSINHFSTITRLDFSNETVNDPGNNLPTARSRLTAVSSSFCGYFGGGYSPPTINTITRLDFSNETVNNPGKNLLTSIRELAAVSGGQSIFRGFKTYGYVTGGENPTLGTTSSNVNKHDLSTNTFSPLTNTMPALGPAPSGTGRKFHFGFSTNYFGYFSGGLQPGGLPGNTNRVSRLDFSNDTWNDPGKDLPTTRYGHTGVSAPQGYDRGYFATGITFVFPNPIGPTNISTVTRIQYSTETVSNPGINMPFVASGLSAVKTGLYGYFTGGITPVSNPVPTQGLVYSNIARLDFSNENISLPVNLPLPRYNMFSFYNNSYGYFCGGTGPNPVPPTPTNHCRIERLDFSSETVSSRTNMPFAAPTATSISSQFFGFTYGTVNTTQIYRFDFSSETFAPHGTIPTPLGLTGSAAVTNGI